MKPTQFIVERIEFQARQEDGLVACGGSTQEATANLREAVRQYNRNVTDEIVWQDCVVRLTKETTFTAYQDGETDCAGHGDTREGALHDLDRQLNKKGGK